MKRGKGLRRGLGELTRAPFLKINGAKPKQKSKKQKKIDEKLDEVYRQMAQEEDIFCTGCGSTSTLSHSHIIPRSKRKDLIAVRDNITWHCMDRCHDIWEHGTLAEMETLDDFKKNMDYIYSVDFDYYNLLIFSR